MNEKIEKFIKDFTKCWFTLHERSGNIIVKQQLYLEKDTVEDWLKYNLGELLAGESLDKKKRCTCTWEGKTQDASGCIIHDNQPIEEIQLLEDSGGATVDEVNDTRIVVNKLIRAVNKK